MPKPETVDDYVAKFPEEICTRLLALRALSQKAAPESVEGLKWGNPAYMHKNGMILFMFSGHKTHANFVFTPSTREAFADELASFRTGKGPSRFPMTHQCRQAC